MPGALVQIDDRRIEVAADGTFAIEPMPGDPTLHIAADGYADAATTAVAGQPVTVRLLRVRGVSVRLLEAGTQTPVPEYEVSLLTLPSDDLSFVRRDRRVPLVHEERAHFAGWAWFREAPPGRFVVWCQPLTGAHVAPMPKVIEWQQGHGSFTLEAAPAQTLTVRVLRADGTPLAEPLDVVTVRVPDSAQQNDDYHELSIVTLTQRAWNHPFEYGPVLFSTAHTDLEGRASLPVPQWQPVSVIAVDGAMALRAVPYRAAADRVGELTLTLPPGVTVNGRTTPQALVGAIHPECAEFLQAAGLDAPGDVPLPSVFAVRQDAPAQETWQARIDRKGQFSFPHLPVGQWQLHLSYHLVNGPGSFQHRMGLVGEYAWWQGGEQQVVIDASRLVPKRVELDCHVAGAPVAQRSIEVRSPASPRKAVEGRTNADGAITLRIEAGRYVLQCRPVQGAKLHQAVVELGGDAAGPQNIDFGTSPVQVQLTAGLAGAAIAGRRLRLRATELQWSSDEATTDANGVAVLAGVARQAGDVVLEVREAEAWTPYALDRASLAASGPRAVSVPLSR